MHTQIWLPETSQERTIPPVAPMRTARLDWPMLWRAGIKVTRTAADLLLGLVFPPSCLACRKAVERHGALCAPCWGQMRFIERPFCERLGTPFAQDHGIEGLLSPEAMANPPVYARARAVAQFEDGPARQLVHRLKYSDRLELALPMGRWMARAGMELLSQADLIISVPMHRSRLRSRKFNQAALLAQTISRQCGVPCNPHLLQRVRHTAQQVGLSRSQRAVNMQGAFKISAEAALHLSQRRIVLVDDVLTSGATINAAARTLLRAGAGQIDVLVFARVVTGG